MTTNDLYAGSNGKDGFYVDNTLSPSAPAVTITNLETSWNQYGTNLKVKGPVTLKNIKAVSNNLDGLLINSSGTGVVTITNSGTVFNETHDNTLNGYTIVTKGPVTITNLDSYNNDALGGLINNSTALSAAPVTINVLVPASTENGYSYNEKGGLEIHSRGAVTLSRMGISDNQGDGLYINNIPVSGAGVPVSVSDSSFIHNRVGHWEGNNWVGDDSNSYEDGLYIESKGVVTLTNIAAEDNDGYGVYIDNDKEGATAGVTINAGAGQGNAFQGNHLDGLNIMSMGPVTLTNIYASNNLIVDEDNDTVGGGFGVYIFNENGAVTIRQAGSWGGNNYSTNGNTFKINAQNGLYIYSGGSVNVAFYQVQNNRDTGMYIDATYGTGTVTVTGAPGSWDNLSYNWGIGLSVDASNQITVANLQANGNGWSGAELYNWGPASSGVTVNAGAGMGNEFQWNGSDGLYIQADGAVSLTNIYSSNNYYDDGWGGYGVHIYNQEGSGAVTIKQTGGWGGNSYWTEGNAFNGNRDGGLWIETSGAVTASLFTARDNKGFGIDIVDYGNGAVILSGCLTLGITWHTTAAMGSM